MEEPYLPFHINLLRSLSSPNHKNKKPGARPGFFIFINRYEPRRESDVENSTKC